MKPISSAISGLANPERGAESSTGSARGEIGYAERRRRSPSDEPEPSETFSAPAIRTETAPATRTRPCFADLPKLPELKPVIVSFGPTGTTTGMALANSSDRETVRSLIAMIQEELTPASPREIGSQLVRLFSHYHAQAGANMDAVAEDWVSDMGDVSAKAFAMACQTWRRSTNRFRPTPGQLLSIIADLEDPIRKKLALCRQLIEREG